MRQYELVERVRRYNPRTDEDLLNRAYVFAMKAHGRQKRASGDPYFSHPLEVAAILTEFKVDDATIVAAMLHDTIEDTTVTRDDIDQAFGEEIGGLVDGLTKLGKLDFVTRHAQQAENFSFPLGKPHDFLAVAQFAAFQIEDEGPKAEHGFFRIDGAGAGATQDRGDAEQQFSRLVRFAQVVVDADLETPHAIGRPVERG